MEKVEKKTEMSSESGAVALPRAQESVAKPRSYCLRQVVRSEGPAGNRPDRKAGMDRCRPVGPAALSGLEPKTSVSAGVIFTRMKIWIKSEGASPNQWISRIH